MPRHPLLWLTAPLLALAVAANAQLWSPLSTVPRPNASAKKPTLTIKCLPPGGTKPTPCSSARAGDMVQIDADMPLKIFVRPAQATHKPITGPTTISPRPLPNRNGSYVLTMPKHWCAGRAGEQMRLQIHLQELQNSGGDADSLGYFQMRC